jgi:maleylacetoacetate isomerase/maleylpyruvate isomerase
MELFTYFRSSAAYRVRIALNLKGLDAVQRPVDLRGGGQTAADYDAVNPGHLVPSLVDGATAITQSLAIIEYLEERYPEPPLLPATPAARAWVRSFALAVACDIHPLNNLRVLTYLTSVAGLDAAAKLAWYRHWIATGLETLETLLERHPDSGPFCHGDRPGLADLCLVPQIYNAERYDCPLADYPLAMAINARCLDLPAFQLAVPERQADATP